MYGCTLRHTRTWSAYFRITYTMEILINVELSLGLYSIMHGCIRDKRNMSVDSPEGDTSAPIKNQSNCCTYNYYFEIKYYYSEKTYIHFRAEWLFVRPIRRTWRWCLQRQRRGQHEWTNHRHCHILPKLDNGVSTNGPITSLRMYYIYWITG